MHGVPKCLGTVLDQARPMSPHQVIGKQDDIFTKEQNGAKSFAGGHAGAVDPADRYGYDELGWGKPHTMARVTLLWNSSGMTQRNI